MLLLSMLLLLMLFPLKDEHVDDADDEMPVRFHSLFAIAIAIAICC